MPTYNKLVRDKIPEIIRQEDKEFTTRILSESEYHNALLDKLREELEELSSSETINQKQQELADLLEIIHAFAKYHDIHFTQIEQARINKRRERGGFDNRIFLIQVED